MTAGRNGKNTPMPDQDNDAKGEAKLEAIFRVLANDDLTGESRLNPLKPSKSIDHPLTNILRFSNFFAFALPLFNILTVNS
ncbi:MAG: hypothetical protein ACI88A_004392 [Paraglaciecola sp.]